MNEMMPVYNTQVVSTIVNPDINNIFDCNATSIRLNEREQSAVILNYNGELYDVASEFVWRRTISILKDRLAFFGEDFIGDMLGYDRTVSIDRVSEQEIIELNCDVGFLKQNAKIELLHHAEQINMYSSREYQMIEKINISKLQATTLISDCILYVLSDMTECSMLSFTNVREKLKSELLNKDSDIVIQLVKGEYFAKRTILRSLMNMARTNKEEEKQFVFHNMGVIIPIIWDSLAERDKYSFGTTYAEISNTDRKDYINAVKTILFNVRGFDYVPENLKSNSFISTAKNLLTVHNRMNNFYNEPLAAKMLASMGTMIPDPALYDCLNATLICITGNDYGISIEAQGYLQNILNGLTVPKWELYLRDLSNNAEFLYQLAYVSKGSDTVKRWCDEVVKRNLNQINFSNKWINDFLNYSYNRDIAMVRKMAINQYSAIKGIS